MKVRVPEIVPETPPWACTFGVDEYGVFAGINVEETVQVFRWIEPGTFQMGSPGDERGRWEDEGPQHEVMIRSGFWLGETPVTQAFYEAVTGKNPSHFTGNVQRPVEQVSWEEAAEYCERLKKLLSEFEATEVGLPSEAQWEYACRAAGTAPLYSGLELTSDDGACPNVDALAWYNKNSDESTHPVSEKLPNDWGVHDMLGNVWEWCEDTWHGNYQDAPSDGSAWVDKGGDRVSRGGGWGSGARGCRCAFRRLWRPGLRRYSVGFRLVLAPRSIVKDSDGSRLG